MMKDARASKKRASSCGPSRSCQTSRPLLGDESVSGIRTATPQKVTPPTPPTSQPVKVVSISTCSIEARGYEVVGTDMAGNEVCRLKVQTLSSYLLKDLYEVIEKNIGSDSCIPRLVTMDGELLPARDSALTLATALGKPSGASSRGVALLRKWWVGIAKGRRKQPIVKSEKESQKAPTTALAENSRNSTAGFAIGSHVAICSLRNPFKRSTRRGSEAKHRHRPLQARDKNGTRRAEDHARAVSR